MKKLVMAATTAALLATAAHADTCSGSFSGFYAGLQAGMGNTSGKVTSEFATTTNPAAAGVGTSAVHAGDKSFVGGLLAGYGMGVGSCAYVGGEVYVNFDTFNSKLVDPTNVVATAGAGRGFLVKAQHQYDIGAKLRLGYTASQQVMIFLGLGVQYGQIKLKTTNMNAGTAAGDAFAGQQFNKTKRNFSFSPSLGVDVFLSKNLFVRGEYTYVIGGAYAKVSDATQGAAGAGNSKQTAIKANLDQQRFMLAVGYKF